MPLLREIARDDRNRRHVRAVGELVGVLSGITEGGWKVPSPLPRSTSTESPLTEVGVGDGEVGDAVAVEVARHQRQCSGTGRPTPE